MTVLEKIDTIILHTPKTGGSSVRWPAINKHGIRYACQHCNYNMLPEEYKNFHKMTFIRNPIRWYKSRYFFDKMKFFSNSIHRDAMTTALSHEYKKSFNETLEAFLNPDDAFKDSRTRKIYKKLIKSDVLNNYTCWNVSYHNNINKVGPGYFEGKTYYQWILNMIGVQHANTWYRLEDQYEYGMKKEFGENVNLIHKNATPKKIITEDYTYENKKIVLSIEKDIINKYGYGRI